jgi:starch phosphorylase
MNQLYDRYLGPQWREEHADSKLWRRAESIPAEELWRTHERRRERLVAYARRCLRAQLHRRGASPAEVNASDEVLDPDALTIGFARRFATYKRATLILRDPARLERILNQPGRPVQIVFAGKAHPRDDAGKALIQQIIKTAQLPQFRRRVVFLEDYDMAVARYLVQGSDIWLNTPLRPLEASGTSGMKALANGALNFSTLDGWWDEAWQKAEAEKRFIGWAIGRGESYDNADYQDQVESAALYDQLEHEIVPAFYERGADLLPRRWINGMKSSVATLCSIFNMQRVVKEYTADCYAVAHERSGSLIAGNAERAHELAAWRGRIAKEWPQIRVESVDGLPESRVAVGAYLQVQARVRLGCIRPDEVTVELYMGRLDAHSEITGGVALPMQPFGEMRDGVQVFEVAGVQCRESGLHGYTVRVLPFHRDEAMNFLPGYVTWA